MAARSEEPPTPSLAAPRPTRAEVEAFFAPHADLAARWRSGVAKYAADVKAYVECLDANDPSTSPPEPTYHVLCDDVLDVVRAAHVFGAESETRVRFPPAHFPAAFLGKKALATIAFSAGEGRLLVQVGAPWETPRHYVATADALSALDRHACLLVGKSARGDTFGFACADGLHLARGLDAPVMRSFAWPHELDPRWCTEVIVSEDASTALVSHRNGVFLFSAGALEARRILPSDRFFADAACETDPLPPWWAFDAGFANAALSPDGDEFVAGWQFESHRRFSIAGAALAELPSASEYPSASAYLDSDSILVVGNWFLRNTGLVVRRDEPHDVLAELGAVASVVVDGDGLWCGTQHGYLERRGRDGTLLARHFVGSSVDSIACDGALVVVGTSAGNVHFLRRDSGPTSEYEIGTAGLHETRRWVFWRDETQPFRW